MRKTKRPTTPEMLALLSLIVSICMGSTGRIVRADSDNGSAQRNSVVPDRSRYPFLSRYATDLTRKARQGRLEPVSGHRAEIGRLLKALSTGTDRSPLLIKDGINLDTAAVVSGLAHRIAAGKTPETLRNKRIFALSLDRLSAGARDGDEFVTRFVATLNEVAASKGQIILFVDNLHQYAGSYANRVASAAIQDALKQNQLRLIGAATSDEYAAYIAEDESLTSLFELIRFAGEAASRSHSSEEANDDPSTPFVGEKVSSDLRELARSVRSENDRVSVILQADDLLNPDLLAVLKRHGVSITDRMAEVGSMHIEVPVKAIEELAANDATNYLSPDVKLATLGHVTATTGTDLIRNQTSGLSGLGSSSLDGSGIGIAVLDSGIDESHRSFKNGVRFTKDFTREQVKSSDHFGHGTHVASTAGGTSTKSGNLYQGIAPGVSIINLRVLDKEGTGSTAALLNALNWILSPADPSRAVSSNNPLNKDKYNIRIVNMSLGAPAVSSYKNDPICRAARALVDAGIVVVAAAGNNGKDANGTKLYGQIHSPGNEPSVITVGAANTFGTDGRNDDAVATYSSRGPTRSYYTDASDIKHYDNIVKPDLIAPGNKLIYASSDLGNDRLNLLVTLHPELDANITDDDNRRMMYLSGTSMATPVVAGTAALLLQANPKLTPNMIKALLMYTAQPLKGFNMLEQGAGEVNVEGAMRVAKLVRKDLSSNTPTGDAFLTTSAAPTPRTTIANQTFTWAQGLIMKHSYLTGTNLIMQYQPIYGQGVVMGDGDVAGDGILVGDDILVGDGILVGDSILVGDGVVMGDNIMTSDGVVMGDGTGFLPIGQLMGDGILIGDAVVMGDGVVMGDAVVMGDGVVMGDAAVQACSSKAMLHGD